MTKIFISYRHSQNRDAVAGHIADRLKTVFGEDNVFIDFDIEPGKNWQDAISKQINQCDVLLVLIDTEWVGAFARQNPNNDWVLYEVRSGLARNGCRIIPILLNNATMPNENELPSDPTNIQSLAKHHALELRTGQSFDRDMVALINMIGLPHQEPSQSLVPSSTYAPSPFSSCQVSVLAIMGIVALIIALIICAIVILFTGEDDPTATPRPTNTPRSFTCADVIPPSGNATFYNPAWQGTVTSGSTINVRVARSTASGVIDGLVSGATFSALALEDDWYYLGCGWVHSSVVRVVSPTTPSVRFSTEQISYNPVTGICTLRLHWQITGIVITGLLCVGNANIRDCGYNGGNPITFEGTGSWTYITYGGGFAYPTHYVEIAGYGRILDNQTCTP